MKCTIPEISWHNRDPVLSVDFQVFNGEIYRFATGGTDTHVLIWFVTVKDDGNVDLTFASDLKRHNRAVNVVRFAPCGTILASGDDEAAIFLWKQTEKDPAANLFADDEGKENKEHWSAIRTLRGHIEDVYDLSWCPNSKFLISGSVDNSAIIWDVSTGRSVGMLGDHKGFVQGVAWDPKDQFVATLCSDRTCRIYNATSRKIVHKLYKANILPSTNNEPTDLESDPVQSCRGATRLFHDDTLKSFFRRLSFTPDGELLIAPSGVIENEDGSVLNVTHVFSRHSFAKPVFFLPSKDKYTLAVRCCPTLFQLRATKRTESIDDTKSEPKPWELYSTMLKLPYRMVFAVATQSSVLFYDTQQPMPFAKVSNIQYTRLSDISWSSDGRILIVSSTDGYCSFVTFRENELGIPHRETTVEEEFQTPDSKPIVKDEAKTSPDVIKETQNTFLTQSPVEYKAKVTPTASPSQQKPEHKRVSLITLFSPKAKSSMKNTRPREDGGETPTQTESPRCERMDIVEDPKKTETVESTQLTENPFPTPQPPPKENTEAAEKTKIEVPDVKMDTSFAENSETKSSIPPKLTVKSQGRRIELVTLSTTTKLKSKTDEL